MFFPQLMRVTDEERTEEGKDWGDLENGQTSNSLDLKESWVLFMFYETYYLEGMNSAWIPLWDFTIHKHENIFMS